MLRNDLKIAFRNLNRHKGYSFINILGLAIGLASSLLIFLYVKDELSYDRFHSKAEQVYRLAFTENRGYKTVNFPITSGGIAPALVKDYPEVVNAVRFRTVFDKLVSCDDRQFYEEGLFYADESVFEVFSFLLDKGDAGKALTEPNTAVITERMAEKFFGREDPLGKALNLDGQDFRITGILKKIPQNSHIKFDLLASMKTLKGISDEWRSSSCYTYLLLQKGYSPSVLVDKFQDFIRKYRGQDDRRNFYLQPLTSIHLHSNLERELEPNSNIAYVYILTAVAVFVLLIACINFMNLSTARSANRAKEVGVRKVSGASRMTLVRQFLGESIFTTILALILSLILVELFLPVFNNLSGKRLGFVFFGNLWICLAFIGFTTLVGLFSGSYPAFFMSAFQPVKVIKGTLREGSRGSSFRKVLVLTQFSLSIGMIIGTFVISGQLDFIQNENLGFDKDHVVVVQVEDRKIHQNYDSLKAELLQNTHVVNVTASTSLPGFSINPDYVRPGDSQAGEFQYMGSLLVDYDFAETLGMELKEGRDFSKEFTTDAKQALILNEEAVQKFGWESAVGKKVEYKGLGDKVVVGVLKNFHNLSKYQKVDALVISMAPDPMYLSFILIKLRPENIRKTLDFLKTKWNAFSPGRPLNFFFLEENYDRMYRKEQKLSQLFRYFTLLAIFIACLGLFGLASFTAEQRTKEVGIRKVLGASVPNIVSLLSLEFTKWVLAANLLAWPLTYYVMHRWLQNFAYRIGLKPWTFILSAVLGFLIALATVSYQALKAAVADPAKSLRYE